MYEIKTKNVFDDFSKNKEMFDFNSCSVKLKYNDNSNALVVSKYKDVFLKKKVFKTFNE